MRYMSSRISREHIHFTSQMFPLLGKQIQTITDHYKSFTIIICRKVCKTILHILIFIDKPNGINYYMVGKQTLFLYTQYMQIITYTRLIISHIGQINKIVIL